jgi:hypothetical protein
MQRSFITAAATVGIVLLGSLVSAQAGGGATSAPSKYNNASHSTSAYQTWHYRAQTAHYPITEFSSSSATSSAPKR